MKISIIQPSLNNLKYLKWSYDSIRKNQGNHEVEICVADDFSDKVIQLIVTIVILTIVCLAWWSTNIREQPHYRTIVLLERRLRRRIHQSRLTTHIQSSSIVEGNQQVEEGTNTTPETETVNNSAQSSEQNKPPAATTSANSHNLNDNSTQVQGGSQNTDQEELLDFVRIMDDDRSVVRRRRLAYYENLGSDSSSEEPGFSDPPQLETINESGQENIGNDEDNHIEIINDTIMEHNYAERDTVDVGVKKEDANKENELESKTCEADSIQNNDSNIRIKLKYLNDDLKLVNGRLEEQLGDFKRRHFHPEYSSNKLVRLIFNGQVLQSDTETLQSCGFFDNCVVHCLIHQQRNTFTEGNNNDGTFTNARNNSSRRPQNNSNQGRDWDLGNLLFVLISFVIGSAWYFRYEYAHLYNVTATVALVAITGTFTIFLIGIYFPDPAPPPPPQAAQEST